MGVYVFYGNEPYIIRHQERAFKALVKDELSSGDFSTFGEAYSFINSYNIFSEKWYAILRVDDIKELDTPMFHDFAIKMRDDKEYADGRSLFVVVSGKVNPNLKLLKTLTKEGVSVTQANKAANETTAIQYIDLMCANLLANMTEGAKRELLKRTDYFNNEEVSLITLENQIEQLKYSYSVIDTDVIQKTVSDMREGKKFALASFIRKGDVAALKKELEQMDYSGIHGLDALGILHWEVRTAYLAVIGIPYSEIKARKGNFDGLSKDVLLQSMEIIGNYQKYIKTGVYSDKQALGLCCREMLNVMKAG